MWPEVTKKIWPGSQLPNGRSIFKLKFKKGSVEEKDDEDGATSVVHIDAWWHLPFTDVNLVSSACATKSSWRAYWKKMLVYHSRYSLFCVQGLQVHF